MKLAIQRETGLFFSLKVLILISSFLWCFACIRIISSLGVTQLMLAAGNRSLKLVNGWFPDISCTESARITREFDPTSSAGPYFVPDAGQKAVVTHSVSFWSIVFSWTKCVGLTEWLKTVAFTRRRPPGATASRQPLHVLQLMYLAILASCLPEEKDAFTLELERFSQKLLLSNCQHWLVRAWKCRWFESIFHDGLQFPIPLLDLCENSCATSGWNNMDKSAVLSAVRLHWRILDCAFIGWVVAAKLWHSKTLKQHSQELVTKAANINKRIPKCTYSMPFLGFWQL